MIIPTLLLLSLLCPVHRDPHDRLAKVQCPCCINPQSQCACVNCQCGKFVNPLPAGSPALKLLERKPMPKASLDIPIIGYPCKPRGHYCAKCRCRQPVRTRGSWLYCMMCGHPIKRVQPKPN